jgi:ABC-2 type transport system ATP-binding protein
MGTAIETVRLTKAYVKRRSLREIVLRPFRAAERVVALQDVTFEVRPGEIFGLLGANGAGKTTLLKILAGLILPSGGRAEVDGADVARDDRAVKQSIGFVTSDERSFYWRLTGRENLHFFAALCGLDPVSGRSRAAALLDSMELTPVADQQFLGYSSGMKQRLAIARALLHDPPILCLDEPTRSLDPIAAKHLRRFVIDRLNREEAKTVLLATHNLQEAEEMCGRLLVLDRGRTLRQGSVAEITAGLPGREQYVLQVAAVTDLPRDPRWTLEVERGPDGRVHLHAALDRGGAALSDLLRGLLHGGGTILSCARREPSLQEVFDLMEPPPARGEGGGRRGERP